MSYLDFLPVNRRFIKEQFDELKEMQMSIGDEGIARLTEILETVKKEQQQRIDAFGELQHTIDELRNEVNSGGGIPADKLERLKQLADEIDSGVKEIVPDSPQINPLKR